MNNKQEGATVVQPEQRKSSKEHHILVQSMEKEKTDDTVINSDNEMDDIEYAGLIDRFG